jgi:hypothetical protein
VQLNYASPYLADFIGVDASLYGVAKLSDSGAPTSNLLDVRNNGQLAKAYLTAGQALIKLKYQDIAELKIGRQLQDSLLLKSTNTRAVPDTYSGVSARVKPLTGVTLYGAVYNQWRARSTGTFEKFKTEATAARVPNSIDYIGLVGVSYTQGPLAVTAEYLNNPGQIKYGGYGGSMSFALQQAAEKALYPGGNLPNKIGGKPQNQAKTAAKSETSTTISPAPAPTPAPAPAPAPAARTVNVNLTLGGRSATIPTSESGADALLKILEQAQGSLGN